MTDFQAYLISKLAKWSIRLFSIVLLPWSLIIVIKEKRFGKWRYEIGRGWDILANKMFEPVFNKKLVKPGGKQFGGDVTISYDMAVNKVTGYDTETAEWWEENLVNKFEKDHLNKTLIKYEQGSRNGVK